MSTFHRTQILLGLIFEYNTGKSLIPEDFKRGFQHFNVSALTTINMVEINKIGNNREVKQVGELAKALLEKKDILVLNGRLKDIDSFLNKE